MSISDDKDRLTIIISKETKEEIKKLANKENRSMGNYIATLLENYINELNNKKNP